MLSYEYHGLVENPDETIKENIQADFNSEVINGNPYTNGELWFNYFNKAYGSENVEWNSKVFEFN